MVDEPLAVKQASNFMQHLFKVTLQDAESFLVALIQAHHARLLFLLKVFEVRKVLVPVASFSINLAPSVLITGNQTS